MITRDELVQSLVDLVEGRLDPAQWDGWWAGHGEEFLQSLSPGQALRFRRAIGNESPIARIAQSQAQAADLLKSWKVPALLDPAYSESARREYANAIRADQHQMEIENAARRAGISRFAARFPGFASFLRRRARDLEELGPPATPEDLDRLQSRIGGVIPPSLRAFLLCARSFRLGDLIQLNVDDIQPMEFNRLPRAERPRVHGMMRLCEFWLDADGDQLTFDKSTRVNDECPIFYYGHEHRPPRVTPVADTFDALVFWWTKGTREWTRTLREREGGRPPRA
jgi:hypothetical protein